MPALQLQNLSYLLPDGRQPFPALNHVFQPRRIGLVGENGCGKSLLGRLLARSLPPTGGQLLGKNRIWRLPQEMESRRYPTIAHLAGVDAILAALRRIAQGSLDEGDYLQAQDRWDCEQRLLQLLAEIGLPSARADTPSHALSGGERQRVALACAWQSGADWLILDEPSNHLDILQRRDLAKRIRDWPGGLILISHEPAILDATDEIVELSSLGLRNYGPGYTRYLETRVQQQSLAQARLETERRANRQLRLEQQSQLEKQRKRASHGAREARDGNQSKLITDAKKDRSQKQLGKLLERQQRTQAEQKQKLLDAQTDLQARPAPMLRMPGCELPDGKIALELIELRLRHGTRAAITLQMRGPERIAIIGGNGSGKSTLLRTLAGHLPALSGELRLQAALGCVDQHAIHAGLALSPIQKLQQSHAKLGESEIRTRLAQLGLSRAQTEGPCAELSGGEKMRVALAAALYAEATPQLLLLDEPDNHLDQAAKQALIAMLKQYQGALLAVSHDAAFLRALHPDRWLWLESNKTKASLSEDFPIEAN
ncbi:ATP-binding cassette domain-containing protein [Chromobacterium sp. IIBBL 290-4]|uniref:ATP-binding cassette domain-containing protein n=1 Tax=Chromobacterium sp. IIBBL 290-4 TaxID=2953890 RepID=UPI0020B838DA|nr:ATP-binding cassette domain-containing protein [Chromobacterium sp. IIBBL 290-4]UTH73511.1 ATP-binding cassette domain-containing protein [Chromobacterium sp. IIBBL 290-4]